MLPKSGAVYSGSGEFMGTMNMDAWSGFVNMDEKVGAGADY